jgi:hypothetical protein
MLKIKSTPQFLLITLALILTGLACATLIGNGSEPQRTNEQLFDGVTYTKEVRTSPRRMVVHIVKVELTKPGVKPLVTPPDNPKDDKPYNARTTSEFTKQNRVQLAINGGGFSPWYDYKLVFFPHTGDKVKPLGTVVYENFSLNLEQDEFPLVLFGGNRPIDIGYIRGDAEYAVSGIRMLVDDGQVVSGLNNWDKAPRTAVGNTQNGQTMIIVVIDGRQSGYSNGATLQELAQILLDNGAYDALELDGGGSSTLVLNPRNEAARVLNSPIHNGVPGRERPVATHIGIFARE